MQRCERFAGGARGLRNRFTCGKRQAKGAAGRACGADSSAPGMVPDLDNSSSAPGGRVVRLRPPPPRIQHLSSSPAGNSPRICPLPRFVCLPAVLTLGGFSGIPMPRWSPGTDDSALSPPQVYPAAGGTPAPPPIVS